MNKKIARLLSLAVIAVGVGMFVCGIVFVSVGVYRCGTDVPSYTSFGGDFYTYSYQATRNVAGNVASAVTQIYHLAEDMNRDICTVMIFAGILTVLFGLGKFLSTFAKDPLSPAQMTAEPAVKAEPVVRPETDIRTEPAFKPESAFQMEPLFKPEPAVKAESAFQAVPASQQTPASEETSAEDVR